MVSCENPARAEIIKRMKTVNRMVETVFDWLMIAGKVVKNVKIEKSYNFDLKKNQPEIGNVI